jgi:hypothetical protein
MNRAWMCEEGCLHTESKVGRGEMDLAWVFVVLLL